LWPEGLVHNFDREGDQRRYRIDATGTQQDETSLVPATVFQKVNSAAEVVIEEFLGTGLPIHSRHHAGIRSAIEHPVGGREVGKVLLVAYIPDPHVDSESPQWLEIGLAPLSDQVVDSCDSEIRKMLEKPSCDDGSSKATDSGN
jgi:hypothetical protein